MEKYKKVSYIIAEQYFPGKEEACHVKIGKNDRHDRFDSTPDGPYVLAARDYMKPIYPGDWVIQREGDPKEYFDVISDESFKLKYKKV